MAENKIGVYFRNLGDRKLEGRSENVRLEDGRPSRKESAMIRVRDGEIETEDRGSPPFRHPCVSITLFFINNQPTWRK